MTVMDWLLDSDPAIRWQVKRDLLAEPEESVWAERARVANEGWGARLLALQDASGRWGRDALPSAEKPDGLPDAPTRRLLRELQGVSIEDLGSFLGIEPAVLSEWESSEPNESDERAGKYGRALEWMWNSVGSLRPEWTSTTHTLVLLRDMGVDPSHDRVRRAVGLVRDNVKWDHDGQDYFAGEVEPCINGKTVALGSYFGEDVDGIVDRLLDEQLEDGGWNCEAENGSVRSSFHTTSEVLDGLLEYERAKGDVPAVTEARQRAQEYMLERRMFRRLSTGEVVRDEWTRFSYPPRWHYDVLRGLDYLRKAGADRDPRAQEAIDLVESKRQPDGRWLLENTYPGRVHFAMDEGDGKPSRWNTLRAMRVLGWWNQGA